MILICVFVVTRLPCFASSSPIGCPIPTVLSKLLPFSNGDTRDQCPVTLEPTPPYEVSGEFLEKALISKWSSRYTSVLFYASWCPFSQNTRSIFDVLSCIYPEIEHFAVEESSTMPSLFSRYGIHSLPAILLLNQTSLIRYHGSKDLASLVIFYKQVTGLEPIELVDIEKSGRLETGGNSMQQSRMSLSIDGMWRREPYLLLCTLFLLLRMVVYVFPIFVYKCRTLWASYGPHLNLEMIGESRQMFGRMVHVIDGKRVWNRLNLCKIRNLHRGAKNARVWASSLTSVSLGESSTTRSAS